jgi:hypothetical protein
VSADELRLPAECGWIRSTAEGVWESSARLSGPVSVREALEIENDFVELTDPDADE